MTIQDKGHGLFSFKQLSYFIALAEHGSISAAASALNMAQPSLSENIVKLERQLDVQLAVRGSRGIQLTEAGVALAKRGGEILKSVSGLIEEIRGFSVEPRGPVTIGLPPSLSILLGVPLLETIHSEYPDVRLHIVEAMSGDILEWMASDRLDMGCVYEAFDSTPFLFEPLLTEELFLVAAADDWTGPIGPDGVAVDPICATDLQQLPLVLTSPTHGARKLQEKFARSIGIRFNVAATIDSLPHIVEMVSRASAKSILSHGAIVKPVAEGRLVMIRIKEPTIRRTAYIVRKRSRPVIKASAVVEACIRSILDEIVSRYRLKATLHAAEAAAVPDTKAA